MIEGTIAVALKGAAKFDPDAQTKPAPKGPAPKAKFCSNCGSKTTPGTRFCSDCGSSVG